VGCWDGTAKVFDAGTGLELFALRGHAGYVQGVVFSPDGSLLASGGEERRGRPPLTVVALLVNRRARVKPLKVYAAAA